MSPEISPLAIITETAKVAKEIIRVFALAGYTVAISLIHKIEGTPEQKRARKELKQESNDRA